MGSDTRYEGGCRVSTESSTSQFGCFFSPSYIFRDIRTHDDQQWAQTGHRFIRLPTTNEQKRRNSSHAFFPPEPVPARLPSDPVRRIDFYLPSVFFSLHLPTAVHENRFFHLTNTHFCFFCFLFQYSTRNYWFLTFSRTFYVHVPAAYCVNSFPPQKYIS